MAIGVLLGKVEFVDNLNFFTYSRNVFLEVYENSWSQSLHQQLLYYNPQLNDSECSNLDSFKLKFQHNYNLPEGLVASPAQAGYSGATLFLTTGVLFLF